MSSVEPSDEEISSMIQAAEGILAEVSSLSSSSGGDDLAAGVEGRRRSSVLPVCWTPECHER